MRQGGTVALQRGHYPGTCFAAWLPCYVELWHPALTMKVVLSASYLGIISKPPSQILWDFSAQDFPYALFRSVAVYISTGSSSVLLREHQDQSDQSSSPKLCREELSPVCCQALQHSREGSWRAAYPGSSAWESWAQQVGEQPCDLGPAHSRADGATEASGAG